MEKFTFVETIAFLVIGILGLKLSSSVVTHAYTDAAISKFMDSEQADLSVSILTVLIFIVPVQHQFYSITLKNMT